MMQIAYNQAMANFEESPQYKRLDEIKKLNPTSLYIMNSGTQSKILRKATALKFLRYAPFTGYFFYFMTSLPLGFLSLFGFLGAIGVGRVASNLVKITTEFPLKNLLISEDRTKLIFMPLHEFPKSEFSEDLNNLEFGANKCNTAIVDISNVEFRLGHPGKEYLPLEAGQQIDRVFAVVGMEDGRIVFEIDLKGNSNPEVNREILELVGKNVLPIRKSSERAKLIYEEAIKDIRKAKMELEDKH